MKISQEISTKQLLKLQQVLSPRLIQMLQTFNYSYSDLLTKVEEDLKDNVTLEVVKYDQLSEFAAQNTLQSLPNKDISEFAIDTPQKANLYDYVLSQIELLRLSKKEYEIALSLIENLDERGYISNYFEIKETINKKYAVKDRKVHDVLKIIQSLEPEGIGARSLKECLLIQVEQHDFESEQLKAILKRVITYHLEELGEQEFTKIAKKLKIEPEGVKVIVEFIKNNLNPNPGINFSGGAKPQIIIPSFEATVQNNKIILTNLEEQKGIQLGISEKYLKMLADPETDEETKEFLKEKIHKAKEFIDNLQKRYENLEKLARFIINRQILFLKKGPIFLIPLLQKEVAEHLNISASTVSRIVAAKYIQTPYGLYPFKQLCPRNHFGKTSEQLKLIIKEIILENPSYSDEKIRLLLGNIGLEIARRTVTKYRLLCGLESSLRRG